MTSTAKFQSPHKQRAAPVSSRAVPDPAERTMAIDACFAALNCNDSDTFVMTMHHLKTIDYREMIQTGKTPEHTLVNNPLAAAKIIERIDVDEIRSYRACLHALNFVDASNSSEKLVQLLERALELARIP